MAALRRTQKSRQLQQRGKKRLTLRNRKKTPASASSDSEIKSTGPHGEQGVSADTITLTDDQIAQIKEGGYKVAIVFHYGGNDWATAQQQGIEDTCEELGMEVVAVTNADFSAEQQVSDIETVMALDPDIIISIPTDATATADAYKRASDAGIKLVFMDNVADGMEAGKDYVSCVSADAYGNGVAAAEILGEKLGGEGQIALSAIDLGNNIALEIAYGTVAGVGAQRPYDQGVTEVKCAALSMLGEELPAFVVCPALPVTSDNVCEAYESVYHVSAPDWLTEAAGK